MLEVKCVRKRRANQRTYELRGEVRRGELLILVFPNCDTGNQEEDDANRNDNIKNFYASTHIHLICSFTFKVNRFRDNHPDMFRVRCRSVWGDNLVDPSLERG